MKSAFYQFGRLLQLVGMADLPRHEHLEGDAQAPCHAGPDRDTASRQRGHHRTFGIRMTNRQPEALAQEQPGSSAVRKTHGPDRAASGERAGHLAPCYTRGAHPVKRAHPVKTAQ